EPNERDIGRVLGLPTPPRPWRSEWADRGRYAAPAGHGKPPLRPSPAPIRGLVAAATGERPVRLGTAVRNKVVGHHGSGARGGEIAPERAVRDQPMALQLFCEQAFDEPR